MKQNFLAIAIGTLLLASCGNYDMNKEGISSGHLKIGIDDSYSLMMDSQIFTYEKFYPNAHIQPLYKPEADVITDLLNDSIQAAVICRPLSKEEEALFQSRKKLPESVKIAVDGVALIVNPESEDTIFTMQQLSKLFTGAAPKWEDLGAHSAKGEMKVVFDNNKSCNARTIREKFTQGNPLPNYCFAVENNSEVIDFVSKNKNAMGVVSVSWLSDPEDSTSQAFLKKIKVVRIIDPTNIKKPEMARGPYQAYIYDQTYPLRRDVYAIRTGSKGSVGTGFVSYLANEKGQLIIHKMGMVAAMSPVRTIRITE
jgi:phosphate transport system substrate-binding protein